MRALLFAILAIAVAVAPAAPCMMARHAAADHPVVQARVIHHHDHGAMVSHAGHADTDQAAYSADETASSPHQHQHHHKRAAGCLATCCPLSCQAAMPTSPWSGAVLSVRPSDPIGMVQEDGVVDAHPVRIERPPRPIA